MSFVHYLYFLAQTCALPITLYLYILMFTCGFLSHLKHVLRRVVSSDFFSQIAISTKFLGEKYEKRNCYDLVYHVARQRN